MKRATPYIIFLIFNRALAPQGGSTGAALNGLSAPVGSPPTLLPPGFSLLFHRVFCVKTYLQAPLTLRSPAFRFCILSGFWKYKREFLYPDMLPLIFYNSVINCLSFVRDFPYWTTLMSFIFILFFKMASRPFSQLSVVCTCSQSEP